MTPARATRYGAVGLIALGLLLLSLHRITTAPIEKDPAQIALMAFNLERHGVISMEEQAPLTPTNYREPASVVVDALAIALIDAKLGKADSADDYLHGTRVQLLKYQNILFLWLLALGALWAARALGTPFYVGLLAAIFTTYPYWGGHSPLNDLYTELQAAAFLMLGSAALVESFKRRSWPFCATAGALFGVLTLIKAATLYVFVGTIAVMACLYLLRRDAVPLRLAGRELTALIVTFGIVITPWMYRNYVDLGTWSVSQRAGVVLMYRAVDSQMTSEEYKGTFYVYAPLRLQGLFGKLLGFSPADLLRNGRLQRLNDGESDFEADDLAAEKAGAPEKTLSYYRQARAERVKMEKVYFAAGGAHAEIEADVALKKKAQAMILDHPGMCLALTLPMLWRGATLVFPLLLILLGSAARQRQYELLAFGLPAFGTVVLYGLLTHFIGRYDLPCLSVAIVALLVSLSLAVHPALRHQTNTARSFV
jgi:hypothetical protein